MAPPAMASGFAPFSRVSLSASPFFGGLESPSGLTGFACSLPPLALPLRGPRLLLCWALLQPRCRGRLGGLILRVDLCSALLACLLPLCARAPRRLWLAFGAPRASALLLALDCVRFACVPPAFVAPAAPGCLLARSRRWTLRRAQKRRLEKKKIPLRNWTPPALDQR